ncbi:MAG: PhoU domain-containing protein, partial [Lachnospiraceae bacterium]
LNIAKTVLFTQSESDIKVLKDDETTVDRLSAGITEYSIKLTSLQISEKEHQSVVHLLQIVSDMERISDYCENISEYAETLIAKKLTFSDIGKEEMTDMLTVCINSYVYALQAFETSSKEAALRVVEEETKADALEIALREKHIQRLTSNQCNTEAGIVFLDMLVCLERISDHARNIAEEVLKEIN